jgi:hypothetical protein
LMSLSSSSSWSNSSSILKIFSLLLSPPAVVFLRYPVAPVVFFVSIDLVVSCVTIRLGLLFIFKFNLLVFIPGDFKMSLTISPLDNLCGGDF